jgi:preprotein translocase subunit YajC
MDLLLFAADEPANGGQPPSIFDMLAPMWPFALVLVLLYFMWLRPQRTEQKKHQDALSAIKKNDRVVTIGGIFGVVMSVRKEKETDEPIVTIKVDEETNAKLRVRLGAIARVVAEQPEESPSK